MQKISKNIFVKENETSFGILNNILVVEMKSSKLNNYLSKT